MGADILRRYSRALVVLLTLILSGINSDAQPAVDSTVIIKINAKAGLQFDKVRFHVNPGAKVELIFTNSDDMVHNIVFTLPGMRMEVVNEAMQLEEKGPEMNYIPASKNVLYSIPVIGPKQSQSITFIAPSNEGEYPYVCTVPGHGFVMYGIMYVSTDGNMPPLENDENIPPSRRQAEISNDQDEIHATHRDNEPAMYGDETPPIVSRLFMPEASPAAIAVRLTTNINYCWDAAVCRFRYAWAGGFLNRDELWKGHADAVAKIMGTIFYRETENLLGIEGPGDDSVKFMGYRLIKGIPEFHYSMYGTEVYERIVCEDSFSVTRHFRIPHARTPVWLNFNKEDGAVKISISGEEVKSSRVQISTEQAKEFSVKMTYYTLMYSNENPG